VRLSDATDHDLDVFHGVRVSGAVGIPASAGTLTVAGRNVGQEASGSPPQRGS
jgi:hypothetical protein